MEQQQITKAELEGQLATATAEVEALAAAKMTSAAAAFYTIECTLRRFIQNY